ILDDAYRSTNDVAVKRAILRSFMTAGDRTRLVALAKSETSPELRSEAVRQLGGLHACAELGDLYQSEQSPDVKKKALQAMAGCGTPDVLVTVARNEKDSALRVTAIRQLGASRNAEAAAALTSVYASDSNADVRKAVIEALFVQQNAKALVDLARAEKNPE